MAGEQYDYVAYLLRLWRANHDREESNETLWHASLEQVNSGERIGFGNLEELCRFLNEEVDRHNRESTGSERSLHDE